MSERRIIHLSHEEFAPFFDKSHEAIAKELRGEQLATLEGEEDAQAVARRMGELGLYMHLVPELYGGAVTGRPEDTSYIDVRSLVLIREALGQISPLGDAIFAVQGLGSYPIVLAGSEEQRRRVLRDVIIGHRIAAFGLTEPEAGSDVASMQTTAQRDGNGWILDGEKTLISNIPIAQYFIIFANADPAKGRKGITAFLVETGTPGLTVAEIPMSIPHPIGHIRLERCRVSDEARLGNVGEGLRIALTTLDAFRISVGAAANGMATRALELALFHAKNRKQFGKALAEQQLVQAYLAEMATELDAARLLVARAAHKRDTTGARVSTEAAMAKMYATEAAQRIIDKAVQIHGGRGVTLGSEVEHLYREIRPLRIYEGTTEIQKLIIARGLLG